MLLQTKAELLQDSPVVLTELDVVDKLLSYAKERQIALNAYSGNHSTHQKREAAIELIRMLESARLQSSPSKCLRMVLKTALNFHYIAPSGRKQFTTWYNKIEGTMESCRRYLNLRAQNTFKPITTN